MREVFHEQLNEIFDELALMCREVQLAVRHATSALVTGDADLAQQVITDDAEIDRRREEIEEQGFELLSLQAPVAGDLRVVVAALRMVSELERMGDLSVHVAKIARLRTPLLAVPEEAQPLIARMAAIADDMVGRASDVIANRDVAAAEALIADDDEMDQLRRQTFTEFLSSGWAHGIEAAVDLALLGRYYERIADHAVSVVNRVVYVVTGENPATIGV